MEPLSGPRTGRPLVLTADPLLVSELMRLAAAAGTVPEVVAGTGAALRAWGSASLVLVGADQLADLAATTPSRRSGVHVVCSGPAGDEVFRPALALGAERVAELPAAQEWLVELLTDLEDGAQLPGVTVGVMGGSGGAGATVFAVALALASSRLGRTLLVDADPLGAGVDRVLGAEVLEGVRWDALLRAGGRLSARSLREALPRKEELSVLAWPVDRPEPLVAFAAREVVSAGRRGFDLVVLDLPRHPDEVTDELVTRCDHLVVVTRGTLPAVAAASRVVARLPGGSPRRHLVVRGGRSGVTAEQVSRVLDVPLLAAMGDQRGLDESVDLGAGPVRGDRGALARAARECAHALVTADPGVATS